MGSEMCIRDRIYRGDIFSVGDEGAFRALAFANDRVELDLSLGASLPANSEDDADRRGMPDLDFLFEVGEGAGVPEYDDDGKLKDFQPANFILGFGQIDGRKVIVGGEDFTVRGGSPNPAGLRKSVYTEQLALQYKVCLLYTSPSPRDS